MSVVNSDELVVVRAIRQAFETHGGPGSAVNPTQNPFFAALSGQFDLLKTARLVINNLDTHRALVKQAAEQEAARQTEADKAEAARVAAAQAEADKVAAATLAQQRADAARAAQIAQSATAEDSLL